ncbi:hypothetical protein PBY51_021907 [Eleginops maclovinus]|uniref:Uncharacterized protein n=1 Tax=Eleginops maclovinus TaxID=56733 RepID=A0AAN7XGL2_ELEMC|nr:hypothetical protein PBY51_021907 [Eleginops maclovinus]
MADRDPVPLPAEVRARLAELELELSEGESHFTAELRVAVPGLRCSSGGCLCRCCSVSLEQSLWRKSEAAKCHKFKATCFTDMMGWMVFWW